MSKFNTTAALAVIGSSELKADAQQLALLQTSVAEQFKRLQEMRHEEALRGLLLGLTLHRVKASLPYGDFGKWAKEHATIGERWVNYLMKLALVFIDKSKATKPELLALPGDQAELALDGMEGAQRSFTTKAIKFVGKLSLSELLETYDIKGGKKLGGARESGTDEPVAEPTAEELYTQSRDEIGSLIERGESLFLKENRLQYLIGHPEEIAGVVASLRSLADRVEKAAKPLLDPKK